MKQLLEQSAVAWEAWSKNAAAYWCELTHDSPMWPIHGQYQCRTCGRHYSVNWKAEAFPAPVKERRVALPAFRSASLPAVILLAVLLATVVQAAPGQMADSTARLDNPATAATQASLAFARYTTGLETAAAWDVEAIDIEASLPKLEKQGRLRAIRRLLAHGRREYQIVESTGDATVKRQVINRYLSAQVQAAAIPASDVAISTVNYKFRYKGVVTGGAGPRYAFLITPRKKREGLIDGELWIDDSGTVVRQSGRLVKMPSIFLKRVAVTSETSVGDDGAEERITHLSVDTRVVGRAELTIHEHPCVAPAQAIGER